MNVAMNMKSLFSEAVPQEDGLFVFEGRHPMDCTMFLSIAYDPQGNVLMEKINEGRISDVEYNIALYELRQSKKQLVVRR